MDCAYNIITANFSGGKTHATTARVYQWSRGIELCITGADNLPQTFKAHFSVQKKGGVATTIVGIDERVTVPNVLFTIGKDIHVWLGASETEDDAEILYTVDIPVAPAPMPEYYDAEDTGVFDAVVEQVSGYAATATAAANSAGASATAAAGSASAAAGSANSASASAASAATSASRAEVARSEAESAQASASAAAATATDKATEASGYASSAGQSATSAEQSKTAAANAAIAAGQAASAAGNSAGTASTKASEAAASASDAAQSATAAAGSATTAQDAAQTATTKAGEASASATAAEAAKTAAQTAQSAAETAATNAGQSASTATAKAADAATSAANAAQSKTDAEAAATRAEQAAATLTVDAALSDTSENPVQNKVITGEITDVKTALDEITTHGAQLFDKDNAVTEHWLPANNTVSASANSTSVIVPVNPSASDQYITVHRDTISSRFTVQTFTAMPAIGSTPVTQSGNNSASAITVPCTPSIKYLLILVHNASYDTGITVATMLDGLMVQYGASFTGYEPYSYGVIIPDKSVSGSSFSDNGIEFISDLIADQTENEKDFIKANSADNLTNSAVTLSWTEGSYYDLTNGSVTTLSGRAHTDKIDCKAGDRISVTNNIGQILFWDKRNALLKYVATSRNTTVTAVAPAGAVKYAFNNNNSAISATDVTQYVNTTATEKHERLAPAKLIYDYTSFQSGKYCSTNDGKITNVNNFYCLPFIPVEQNHKYRTQTQTQIVYYDANLAFMSAMLPGGDANNTGATVEMDFTTPVGCAYVSINSRSSHEMVFDLDYTVAGFINNPQKLQGKSVVCFGDSITGNYAFGDNYPYEIEKFTGAKTYNCGFGGCRMELINTDSAHTNPFSMCGIVDAIEAAKNGDTDAWDEQDTYAMSISRMVYFRLQILKAIDWDNVDIVTIAYGTNEEGYPQDDENDKYNKYTYAGATRYAVEKLLTLYPKLRVVLLTPIYRYHTAEQQDSDSWTHPIYGGKLTDNVATLISVGKELKVPVLDLYYTLGINITNYLSYFGDDDEQQDGTHINSFGREQMGRRVAGELSRLF